MQEKEHHIYGGSSTAYWVNCYGWASRILQLEPEKPGPAAKRGTALHTGVLEVKVKQEIENRLYGTPLNFDYSNIPDWPLEGPEFADEFWKYLWTEILEEFVTGKIIYIEKKLMLFPDLDAGGTADIIVLWYNDKGKLVCALGDCKFGRIRVEPSDEQLKFYLTCVNKIYKEKGKQIDEFISFVYQPTHYKPFTTHHFTKSEIERAEAKYEKAILESKKDKPKFKAGDHCEYCKVRGNCQTNTAYIDKKMEMMVLRNKEEMSFIPPETLSDEIISKVILHGDKIINQIEAIKKEGYLRLINGNKIEGLKLIAGTSRRTLKDSEETRKFLSMNGIDPCTEKLVSITEATNRFKQIGKTKKEADELLAQVTEKSDPPPKITTSDDPRPELIIRNPSDLLLEFESEDSEF